MGRPLPAISPERYGVDGLSSTRCTVIATNTYYSLGGGFYVDQACADQGGLDEDKTALPYPFETANELLALCQTNGLRISELNV